uniref:Uncharacterized protein n=1 Tax=Knipowitschia caucasica TaxID=637954 RepID=A0AAV2LCB0_KNICA
MRHACGLSGFVLCYWGNNGAENVSGDGWLRDTRGGEEMRSKGLEIGTCQAEAPGGECLPLFPTGPSTN